MTLSSLAYALRQRLGRFRRDERGVTALEFAILTPFLFMLYMGGVEVQQEVATDRKVSMVARAVADLASRTQTVTDSDVTNMFAAAAAIIQPFSTTPLKITLSSVSVDAQGRATVVWSEGYNSAARTRGTQVTIPTAFAVAGTTQMWGEVQYAYKPTIGAVLTGTFNLSDQMFMRPRLAACVTRTTGGASVC
jgi:Flp pilus assembly protein TadG